MNHEGAEIVRESLELYRRGGVDALAAATHLYDDDIEFHELSHLPEPGVYRGMDAIAAYFHSFIDLFDYYSFEAEGIEGAGSKFVVFTHQRAKGKASGVEVENRNAWVVTLRDGRVWRFEVFEDVDEALAAAELTEADEESASA